MNKIKNILPYLQSFFIGLLTIFASAPFDIFPVLFVFFYFLLNAKNDKIFICLLIGFFVAHLHWIVFATAVDIAAFWPVAILGMIGIPVATSIIYFIPYKVCLKFFKKSWIAILIGFILSESFVSHLLFNGFPWLKFGYFISHYNLGIYKLLPDVVVSGLVISCLLALHLNRKIFIATLLFISGFVFYKVPQKKLDINILIVQQNIPQPLRIRPDTNYFSFLKQFEGKNADVIVMPEGSFDIFEPDILTYIKNNFKAKLVIFGTNTVERVPNLQLFNSFYAYMPESNFLYRYDKEFLVPFGEYIPFRSIAPNLIQNLSNDMLDFTSGNRIPKYFEYKSYKIVPNMCYESIFHGAFKKRVDETSVIFNITNDGWFGDSVGPYQHLRMSQILASKTNSFVVRASNNGISAIIDNNGKILKRTQLNTVDTLIYN